MKGMEVEGVVRRMEGDEEELKEQVNKDFEMAMFLLNVRKMELLQDINAFYQDKKVFPEI